jgi:uracil-DNA glycosylase
MLHLPNSWTPFLKSERKQDYFKKIISTVQEDAKTHNIFPDHKDIFRAFEETPIENIRVVILGQNPYPTAGNAMGLSFSVPDNVPIPASLRNIFKELNSDLNIPISKTGNLLPWARNGVFLLNSSLTVIEGQSNSHLDIGWEILTDRAIQEINKQDRPIVFLLFGKQAQKKEKLITSSKHFIITSGHPSFFSQHLFLGTKPFSRCNNFLVANGQKPIDWNLSK